MGMKFSELDRMLLGGALRKKPFKGASAGGPDPVPSGQPGYSGTWRPGGHAPDPTPAVSADKVYLPAFKPGGHAPDPVPARSA